ncbi:MAG: PspC domain-containing protein [Alistipes sp.]
MKETLNVNIGSQAFVIDQDAYGMLQRYLDDIRCRLRAGGWETMVDVELRIAEIFRERIGASAMRVVSVEIVRQTMLQMGTPADFGECGDKQRASDAQPEMSAVRRKLYRSRTDRSIAGICGGLAAFFGCDVSMLRLVTLLMILFGGVSIWVYILLWIIIPKEPEMCENN